MFKQRMQRRTLHDLPFFERFNTLLVSFQRLLVVGKPAFTCFLMGGKAFLFCVFRFAQLAASINHIRKKDEQTEAPSNVLTMKIRGMMCGHCEARVKKALEAFAEVESAVPDHKKGIATVTLRAEVDRDALKAAVEKEGYKVLKMK